MYPRWHGGCTYGSEPKCKTTSQEIRFVLNKKLLSRLFSILALGLSLTFVACGGGEFPDLNTPTGGNPPEEEQVSVEAPEAPAGTQIPGTPTAGP